MERAIVLLCTGAISTAHAQSLLDTNSVWNVVDCVMNNCWTSPWRIDGDTLIGDEPYWKMHGPYEFSWPVALREDTSGRVFMNAGPDGERLLYDFGLMPGDLFQGRAVGGCSYENVVAAVDTVVLMDGSERKRIIFADWGETWIQGLGSLTGLLNVGLFACSADRYAWLLCYSRNDSLLYQAETFSTCDFNTLGVPGTTTRARTLIHPNPIGTIASVEAEGLEPPLEWCLYDALGRPVQIRTNIADHRFIITRDALTSGIYSYLLRDGSGTTVRAKLMIE
ncbi:MAG: T9SS type A sorting domain-containing protein [Bacteroidetes bacterium]|nr:T9SS type A sorting domain-containing protein [Bacteroidota bacterium]